MNATISKKPKRILLTSSGLTPQIITETLYALSQQQAWLPDEIHVVTTTLGKQRILDSLLGYGENDAVLAQLREEYSLPPIRLDEGTIHLISDAEGLPLSDIRSIDDNDRAANLITALITELTDNENNELHVSLAGGRKTMGFYTGYALSLYGRPQDRLSHVLISEPFENLPGFYYPTRDSCLIERPGRFPGQASLPPVDARDAIVTLADIPYVRMRDNHSKGRRAGASFSLLVDDASARFETPSLHIHRHTGEILCGSTGRIEFVEFDREGTLFPLYLMIASATADSSIGVQWDESTSDAYLQLCHEYMNEFRGQYEATELAIHKHQQNGSSTLNKYFRPKMSLIKSSIIDRLPPGVGERYVITGKRHGDHGTFYRIDGVADTNIKFT